MKQPGLRKQIAHYNKPPLIEAVYEFFISEPSPIETSELIPLFQAEFPKFSEKPEFLVQSSIEIELNQGAPTITKQKKAMQERCRLRTPQNPDNNLMIQFDPGMFALNVFQPYHHFEEDYYPLIERLYRCFVDNLKPNGFKLMGQRYINYITLPDGSEPQDYFSFYPKFSPEFTGGSHPRFAMQVEHSHLQKDGSLLLSLNQDMAAPTDQLSFYLDIYARWDGTMEADWEKAQAWQFDAHQAIIKGFHSAITYETKKLFN